MLLDAASHLCRYTMLYICRAHRQAICMSPANSANNYSYAYGFWNNGPHLDCYCASQPLTASGATSGGNSAGSGCRLYNQEVSYIPVTVLVEEQTTREQRAKDSARHAEQSLHPRGMWIRLHRHWHSHLDVHHRSADLFRSLCRMG